ncbi:MAG TPA: elongation factor Ts [Firmicutes bacterium]|nr:elongation factor Ts [Bacillota bacterium]
MMITAKLVNELRSATGAGMMDCKKALVETNGDFDEAVEYLRKKGIAKAQKKADRIAAEGLANVYIKDNVAAIVEVNSETDFVSKNENFKSLVDEIGNAILTSGAKTLEEALKASTSEGTVEELIIAKTATIGEKLSLRRIEVLTKNDDEVFGSYIHMGGKIAVLTLVKGANEDVARDVAMQAAAMKPEYLSEDKVPAERVEKEKSVLIEQAMAEGKPQEIAEKMVAGRLKKFFKEICLLDQAFIKDGDIDVKTYVKNNGGEVLEMVRYEVGEGMEHRSENFADEVMSQLK